MKARNIQPPSPSPSPNPSPHPHPPPNPNPHPHPHPNPIQALNIQLREEEADKIRDNFEKAKARDAYLLKQMAYKTARAEQEKEEEMYEAEQIKQWMGDDDAIFDQYAQMCLDEWVAQGKNPKPMELVLQKQRSTAGKLH